MVFGIGRQLFRASFGQMFSVRFELSEAAGLRNEDHVWRKSISFYGARGKLSDQESTQEAQMRPDVYFNYQNFSATLGPVATTINCRWSGLA